jgi:hypothetical protein
MARAIALAALHPITAAGRRLARRRLAQRCGGAHERRERCLVELAALVKVDRAPDPAVEAGVEQLRRVSSEAPLAKVGFTAST